MKQGMIIIFLALLSQISIFAQHSNYPLGAGPGGMSGLSVISSDVWAASNNQANMAGITSFSAGVYYENRFLLKELGYKAGAAVLPVSKGVFGLTFSQFGYSQYNESDAGIAYSMPFGDHFSAGIRMSYVHTKIGDIYGSKGAIVAEGGLSAKITPEVTFGMHLYNPGSAKLSSYQDERIPTIFKAGIAYTFSEQLIVGLELSKDINYDPVVSAGFEYLFNDFLYLRAGINARPALTGFGFGLKFEHFRIDFASTLHPLLGYSPQASIVYQLQPAKPATK
ncbi:MAG: hypothetical protein KKA07_01825 [Bacteroidetes bacterium]|nr:hypothetical protein [Bacteroidota bacterium]MBU1717789.1 hypothetical protein [Bacteroidota bacterium]